MQKREYKFTLTEENKSKVEQFLKLLNIDANIVEAQNIKEPEKEWPQDDDLYYYISGDYIIDNNYFTSGGIISEHRLAVGNCFKTKEEAEFELERLKVLAEMKKFAEPEDNRWDGYTEHWTIYFDNNEESIYCWPYAHNKFNNIYFVSQEKAKECIEYVGEDRIKKYYLRIKE